MLLNKKRDFAILVCLALLLLIRHTPIHGATTYYDEQAEKLHTIGIVRGTNLGFELERELLRVEGSVMLVRLLGDEAYAIDKMYPHPFNDVPSWADAYVGYLYEKGLTRGVSPDSFGSQDNMTANHYSTFILRSLGYDDGAGDFLWNKAMDKANSIELISTEEVNRISTKPQFLRDDMIGLSYYALLTKQKDSNETLLDRLIRENAIARSEAIGAGFIKEEKIYGIKGVHIGDSHDYVREIFGSPARQEPSAYGYVWWVYNQDYDNFIMVGLDNGQVVNLYTNSLNWEYQSIQVGASIQELYSQFPYQDKVIIEYDNATFRVNQHSDSPMEKYLTITDDGIAIEFYLDIHEQNTVTAIRLHKPKLILAKGNYSMNWTHPAGQPPEFRAEPLTNSEQEAVDHGNKRNLFDIVNSIRVRKGLNPLDWHQEIADVAYSHSVDMRRNNFFSHNSPNTGGVASRVNAAGITYRLLLENIAFGQIDAIEANEALMNSLGHRINILNNRINSVGTGVYFTHYTQKFLRQ